jgi:hypothetical protein
MFFRCKKCFLVFYCASGDETRKLHTCPCLCLNLEFESIEFLALSQSQHYSEAGGDIVGIDTTTTVEPYTKTEVGE